MVFFDVGGTILRVEPSVGEVYSAVAGRHGIAVKPSVLQARFAGAWRDAARRSRERRHECSDAILREEWLAIVTDTFGESLPQERLPGVFAELYERFVSPDAWRLVPGARETFADLRRRGLRLGILSNWDSRLRETLERLDLLGFFDPGAVIISHEVGFEKPHPRIFERAIAAAGEPPCHILHIGDCREADIAPARSLGMRTLWITSRSGRAGDDAPLGPECEPCAESFADLATSRWDVLLGPPPAAPPAPLP